MSLSAAIPALIMPWELPWRTLAAIESIRRTSMRTSYEMFTASLGYWAFYNLYPLFKERPPVLTFESLIPGKSATVKVRIDHLMMYYFGRATGDFNPVHFEQEIVFGILLGGIVSRVLGTQMPGPGTLYKMQTLRFRKKVMLGDEITVSVEVVRVTNRAKRDLKLKTTILGADGEVAVSGYAYARASRSMPD